MEKNITHPRRISFHGAAGRAAEVERKLAFVLAAWPAFAGFRVHGWQGRADVGEVRAH
ncbi:MAG TPA: hypothetical protein VJM09_08255 [Sphingobium sp.]|nr:hypothetical protein [Sphingobium sp.]